MAALFDVFRPQYWPLVAAMVVMLGAAAMYLATGRVPNAFVLPMILTAWVAACVWPFFGGPRLEGNFLSSLVCTGVGFLTLCKAYRLGLGAGCLKAQMAFGAWVGCALSLETAVIATFAATLWSCALLVVGAIVWGRLCGRPVSQFFHDEPPEPGEEDEPFEAPAREMPAQVWLSLGTIAGLFFLFWLDAQGQKPYLPHNRERIAAQAANLADN
jgi:hypothetical protein